MLNNTQYKIGSKTLVSYKAKWPVASK